MKKERKVWSYHRFTVDYKDTGIPTIFAILFIFGISVQLLKVNKTKQNKTNAMKMAFFIKIAFLTVFNI